jgi:hypothetical protein
MIKRFLIFLVLFNLIFSFVGATSAEEEGYNKSFNISGNTALYKDMNQHSNNYLGENYSIKERNQLIKHQNRVLGGFQDLNDCASLIIHISNGHDLIAHRRDSPVSTNIYINDSFKIAGRDALQQYKKYNDTKDFFHVLISSDGWLVGCGGTHRNVPLESIAAEIMNQGSITYIFIG